MRLSTTARMAALAIVLTLIAGLVPVAFLWRATHDDAIEVLRRDTGEQADALAATWRRSGLPALRDAVEQVRSSDDPAVVAAIVDRRGVRVAGAGPDRLTTPPAPGFRIERLAEGGSWGEREAGVEMRRVGDRWLVNGRLLDDWEAAQRTIERALALSALVSLALGIAGGLALTRYVTRRVDAVATTADAVAAGNLARRVATDGGDDAFDRLGLRVNAMLDRIERLMAELRLMTDSLAHDLRSPIARLRARAEAALAASDHAQREAALGGLITETDVVTRMLTVLLEISRSEASERSGFTLADPAEVMAAVADLYEPLLDEGGTSLVTAFAAAPPLLLHRELLSQAVTNLIDNALRHAGEGRTVTLRVLSDATAVRMQVEDRGPGIAPEDRDAARRRFGRLDPARSRPGAGLGLALVEAVARLHGGTLDLSDNAPGLIATIVLPRG